MTTAVSSPIRDQRIEGPQTIDDVEAELKLLYQSQSSRLLLPVNLQKAYVGGQAALIQLIVTWARRNQKPVLLTHAATPDDANQQLDTLAGRPFGFVALALAEDVVPRTVEASFRSLAKSKVDDEIRKIWLGPDGNRRPTRQSPLFGVDEVPGIPGHGSRVFIATVDGHPKESIPQCYFSNGTLRQRDDFVAIAKMSIIRAAKLRRDTPVSPDLYDEVGAIFHELFKNTDEWAVRDIDGMRFRRSVRGLIFEHHSLPNEASLLDACGKNGPMVEFIARLSKESNDRVRFLEISVFDSGCGLAKRWLHEKSPDINLDDINLNLSVEFNACLECLRRHRTTSQAIHKGIGLDEVLTTLAKLRAFLRIRTGRLSLYRDFLTSPANESGESTDSELFDWRTQTKELTEFPRAEGVLYTMLIPISF